jgi:hypothetical protein
MLLERPDCLVPVVCFSHENHVRFAFEQASDAIQNEGMIICAKYADLT